MTELAALLEATSLAQALKASRWLYPLINAGHILGIALLVGAVIPMDVAALRGRDMTAGLHPWAIAGLLLAAACGLLLFITQAGDYVVNGWFRAKMALLALAVANALWHLNATGSALQRAALPSLILWPAILVLGRMIGYSG
ncbi:hypothetical protein EF888_08455 [Silicimonas algicola]|uniref:DUF2214 domain-containing protein n=1 Tax=Silicimonas algicola TaxID=1826607 RepID=A0A316GPE0_9RHOB|nr:hypothetical protein [Silicimonas algicola]AZQ67160.1 hypothetical protein EF888_08455 [Silicimonas algicola]PWK56807.1 hypothetical protein C8D95_10338 [Silicimonas algicola]